MVAATGTVVDMGIINIGIKIFSNSRSKDGYFVVLPLIILFLAICMNHSTFAASYQGVYPALN